MKLHNMAHVSSMTLLGTIKLFKVIFRLSKISEILQNRSHGFDRGEQNSQNFENFNSNLIFLNFCWISFAWENLPINIFSEYWHFIMLFSDNSIISSTTLRCLYAYLCFHLQYLLFRFRFLKFWKKLYSYLQRELNQNPEIRISNNPIPYNFWWVYVNWLRFDPIYPYDMTNLIWPILYGP